MAETKVANVDMEGILVTVPCKCARRSVVLGIEFRQLLDVIEVELLTNGGPLPVLVDDSPHRCRDSDRRSGCPPARPRNVDCRCNGGTGRGCY